MSHRRSIAFLLGLSLTSAALADDTARATTATPDQTRQCVQRAIAYLQTESAAWLTTRKCSACHHAPMPLWALSEAERHGYEIDEKYLADTIESLLGGMDQLMASKIYPNPADPPDPRPQGRGLNMGLPFLAVAAKSRQSLTDAQKQSLNLIIEEILNKQQPDGSWEFFATLRRPPINESQTSDTAWIILALQPAGASDVSDSQRQALGKAKAWLAQAEPAGTTQDKAVAVLLAVRADQGAEDLQAKTAALLTAQREDGGWNQLGDMPSDAFATGQALYVLSLAGLTTDRLELRRAVNWLVAKQNADGTWPMTSRSTPDGSPGSAKLLSPITCAATAWALLGLAVLEPRQVEPDENE